MTPEALNVIVNLYNQHPLLIGFAIIWSVVWQGFGLWRAAELRQKYWFLAIFLIHTLGILEIIYIFFVAKKYKVEIVGEER